MTEPTTHSIWLRPERAGRGPAPAFDRDRIAAAGIALADADGLTAVTMRAVALALGAGPASLYRYVATRDELLELMIDQVNGEISYAALGSGHWLDDLLALARQSRGVYLAHPWLLDATATRTPWGRARSPTWSTPWPRWPTSTSAPGPSWRPSRSSMPSSPL